MTCVREIPQEHRLRMTGTHPLRTMAAEAPHPAWLGRTEPRQAIERELLLKDDTQGSGHASAPADDAAAPHAPPGAPSTTPAFHAHSVEGQPESRWQTLPEHLHAVGRMAGDFAAVFNAQELAQVMGWLHDLGKYTLPFQARLRGSPLRVDHSTWGARIAQQRLGVMGQLMAYGIAGHHAGLANGQGEGERTALSDRIASTDLPALHPAWEKDIPLPARLALPAGLKLYGQDRQQALARQPFQMAFLARMLFSCLVDADFIDTERFYLQARGGPDHRSAGPACPALPALRAQLDTYLRTLTAECDPAREVNRLRADILRQVRERAECAPGLFSLTVPTGGGKTLASLAFALDHAIRHGLQRVIFVIPFTSIVEQNAAVFRKALGPLGDAAVLEHHSAFTERQPPRDDPEKYQSAEKLRLAMENWDAPIVVTTAVQFFESLFAARPSQCRKLHHIAGSVVVLDEAQTMPLQLLKPCVATIDELARNYRTSVVLCTATQPVLEAPAFDGGLTGVRELAPEPTRLFQQLERVRVRHVGTLDDAALAGHLRAREQVLCIVNNRRHARAVYEAMADLPGARHLTTLMCAKHRSEVLDEVRQMLKAREPCRVVSTSLIEAGVDVDFPTVLRAEAGLDSIAQAAGRCNREGLRNIDASEVLVFAPANEDWAPPPKLKQYAQAAREVLRQCADDPLSPEAIARYFALLYWQKGGDQLDVPDLMGLLKTRRPDSLPMETLATKFRMIDSVQMPVIVPYDDAAREALEQLRFAEGSVGLARKLQPYVVQLPRQGFDALYQAGAIAPVRPDRWGEQFVALANLDIYNARYGLSWDHPSFLKTSSTII
ncbi:CRISPR-associated endonuclease Cas3'' [Acidovorax sp. NCPPB 3859]|nr:MULTISPECIES: CRISPR-associated endonuclease Cas3'' [unclassified Acidovorax]MDA8448288.1 CRISPR-associated endonuclease Cas3'' [Acidovorax sp. GBBC 3297]MDA8457745.1 CRISPR-associated endonuclease Cas3'' [Acidovorax sp. GBBC 3333]MDA8462731.1 CRISPR-associated endonuclease Cas3'' [Acidovorax sp. GBBC 3332]MDA8467815.1 CRISPR-associated endonuclease Cas3'' [Acidovorax sp. GBBC 3299]WCM77835.1 CRISPR-associated endonuclease Cas3'' [Acidovorax sp. GBBC 712]